MLGSLAVKEQEAWAGKRGWKVLVGCRGLEVLEGSRTQLVSWGDTFCARLGNFWWGPTSYPSAKESPDTPFFFCSGPSQPSNFWEGSLRCLPWAQVCSPSWPGSAAGDLSPAACGGPSWLLSGSQLGLRFLHLLNTGFVCTCRARAVNLNLGSCKLSGLAQIEGKT